MAVAPAASLGASSASGDASSSSSASSPSAGKPKVVIPPGMVMGPDGKPCKICTAFRNWSPGSTNTTEPDSNREKYTPSKSSSSGSKSKQKAVFGAAGFASLAAGTAVAAAPTTTTSKQQQVATDKKEDQTTGEHDDMSYRGDKPPPDCPPDVEVLGNATWTFLHTTAAYFPLHPTPAQRANMLSLLRSLPVVYPCTWCAQDFGNDIATNAPDVSSGPKLSEWLCQRHNEVNKKLGKPIFDCAKVDERWKDGPSDGRCD